MIWCKIISKRGYEKIILYQMIFAKQCLMHVIEDEEGSNVARPPRLERGTLCLEGRCSIQLSYGRTQITETLMPIWANQPSPKAYDRPQSEPSCSFSIQPVARLVWTRT